MDTYNDALPFSARSEVPPVRPVTVSIENLPPEGRAVPFEFAAPEVGELLASAEAEGAEAVAPLTGEAQVLPSGRDVFVLGRLHTRVAYGCVRCLERFERDLDAEFHLVYTREPTRGDAEMELHREDLEVEVLAGPVLDLRAAVEEQLFLALEPHPVCRESCRGLCPDCGANRNLGDCGCPGRAVDPRFAALASRKPGGTG